MNSKKTVYKLITLPQVFLSAFLFSFSLSSVAETKNITAEESRLSLQQQINILRRQNAIQQASINQLNNLLSCVIKNGTELIIEGCNLHVRNAQGQTASTDETGNLIIGYNEDLTIGDGSLRTGSHNLIIGEDHRYISHGTIVHGLGHMSSRANAAAIGGSQNQANGTNSVVVGGRENEVPASNTVVISGRFNSAGGSSSAIISGQDNVTHSSFTVIAGGAANETDSNWGAVFGGQGNESLAPWSVVVGGQGNVTNGSHSTVTGGLTRSVDGPYDWRAGGLFQTE